jgi:ribonuclease VapC
LIVLDASALLAFLQGDAGERVVEEALLDGAACGAANWSEVAQKVRQRGADWGVARALLLSYQLVIEPAVVEDAERAAESWTTGSPLSLGDRLCLGLADRLGVPVLTADAAWGSSAQIRQIR